MDFLEYIKPELLILIPVLYLVGIGLKKSAMNDKFIPLVLGGISIVLSAIWVLATSQLNGAKDILMAIFIAITQGILIAGASVYANQIFKQLTKED